MANRYPLIVDSSSSLIKELPAGDSLLFADNDKIAIGAGTDLTLYHDGTNSYITNATGAMKIATETSGIALTIGHTTSETTVADNLTVTGDFSVGGNFDVTGTLDFSDSAISNVGDISLDSISGDSDSDTAITFSGSNVITIKAANEDQVTFIDGAIVPSADDNIDLGTSSVEFKDAFFDGTVTSDAFAGPLTGAVTGNADTATEATNITAAANNSTDETVYLTFVDGATGTQGIETDTGLTYNPSSGILTATQFTGNVTGNVTGNASGTAATVTTAAQPAITSLGTLTTLTVDDMTLNGSTITDSGDFTIDCGADIILDADGGEIRFKDAGTEFGNVSHSSGDFFIQCGIQDKDIKFRGDDGGSAITALQLDMSEAGAAIFNNSVDATNYKIAGSQGSDGQILTSTGSGVAWETSSAATTGKAIAMAIVFG